jgi:DNA modification methylase
VPTEQIRAYERKLRRHSDRQVDLIAGSICEFGFNNPIIVDGENVVVAGHGRLLAALELGLASVPVIRLAHLTPERIQAYRIGDNRLADLSSFDDEVLKLELSELIALNPEFDLEIIGFNTAELDIVLSTPDAVDADDEAPSPAKMAITRPGDTFNLGQHRMACANALDGATWAALMGDARAAMVFTDPPYNLKVDGCISGGGKTKHREFEFASGEMSEREFTVFLTTTFERLAAVCRDGTLWYVWMDHRHMYELITAGRSAGLAAFNLGVWDKMSGGMGSYLRSRHELCFIWKQGSAPHVNNNALGRYGRNRDNLWPHPGLSSFGRGRAADLADHPTVKPLALAVEAIKDCTHRGDLVIDAFLGSGTTILAAERTGRICYGTEIDPIYCDVIIRRWEERTGIPAVHAETGKTFAELSRERERLGAEAA